MGLGFGVWGLGFGVWGLGFGVWGSGCGVWGLGFGVWGYGIALFEVEHTVALVIRAAWRRRNHAWNHRQSKGRQASGGGHEGGWVDWMMLGAC